MVVIEFRLKVDHKPKKNCFFLSTMNACFVELCALHFARGSASGDTGGKPLRTFRTLKKRLRWDLSVLTEHTMSNCLLYGGFEHIVRSSNSNEIGFYGRKGKN